MGAYKRDVVVVIKMGAYIHGVLILCGCLLSRFYGMYAVWWSAVFRNLWPQESQQHVPTSQSIMQQKLTKKFDYVNWSHKICTHQTDDR